MNTIQEFFMWDDFETTLNCISRWFSIRARCDRFIAECIMKNQNIQDWLLTRSIPWHHSKLLSNFASSTVVLHTNVQFVCRSQGWRKASQPFSKWHAQRWSQPDGDICSLALEYWFSQLPVSVKSHMLVVMWYLCHCVTVTHWFAFKVRCFELAVATTPSIDVLECRSWFFFHHGWIYTERGGHDQSCRHRRGAGDNILGNCRHMFAACGLGGFCFNFFSWMPACVSLRRLL